MEHGQALVNALQAQRNAALNAAAQAQAELIVVRAQIAELQAEVGRLRQKPDAETGE